MAKDNKLVNRTRFSNSLRNDLDRTLTKIKDETKISKSLLLDEAIELLASKYGIDISKEEERS